MANPRLRKFARTICLAAAMASPGMPLSSLPASASLLNIATVPLAKSAGAVNPNLLFLLDSSGSMAWEYLPDYIYSTGSTDFYACFDNGSEGTTAGKISESRRQCVIGDPPFMSPDFNKVYYNPDYTYPAGVNWDKSSKGDQTITAAKTDPYGVQGYDQLGNAVATIDLTTKYPDRVWCNTNARAATDTTNCKTNSGYDYPSQAYSYFPSSGGVNGSSSSTYANGSKVYASGQATTLTKAPGDTGYVPFRFVQGAPYYYRIVPTEYCNDATLKTCVAATAPTGSYTYPAPVRFCKDPGVLNPLVDCQGLYNASAGYVVPKFLGYVQTSSDGEKAFATITISAAGLAKGLQITGLKINSQTITLSTNPITVGAIGVGTTADSVATALNTAISTAAAVNPPAPGFNFTKAVSGSTVTLTASAVGTLANGSTITIVGPAAGDPGSKATWKLVVGSDTTGPKTYRIGNIKVGTAILANDPIDFHSIDLTTGAGQSSAAQVISNAINSTGNGGYTATWSGNEVLITAPLVGSTTDNLTVSAPSSYAAVRATGTVIIGSAAAGTKTYGITTIKVGTFTVNLTTPILVNADLSSPSGQAAAATAVATKINATGYSATATDNVVTIAGAAGTTDNGKAVTVTPSGVVKGTGKLAITSANSGSTMTSLVVDGHELLGTTVGPPTGTSGSGRAQDLLSKIAARINATTGTNGGFTAVYVSGSYYITVTAPTSVPNGATFSWTQSGVTVVATGGGTAPAQTTAFSGAMSPMPISGTTAMSGGGNATLLPTGTSRTYNGTDAVGTIPTAVTPFDGGMAVGGTSETRRGVGTFKRCDITATADCNGLGAGKFPRTASRIDCAAAGYCTYAEEAKNFANWYAYYRTRMQSMKSAAGLAFTSLTDSFRVGFNTIDNSTSPSAKYLEINEFGDTQKQSWYTKFHAINPSSSTPLRAALSTAGRMFAGKVLTDPVQYACQQNFVLMTTDGYWNDSSCTNIKDIGGSTIGNLDGALGTPRPYFDGYAGSTDTCSTSSTTGSSSSTLSDIAQYYYATDIRNGAFSNCTGAPDSGGTTHDVCPDLVHGAGNDNLPTQHMTTYTLGLGVDGTVAYQSDYQTATSGDFFNIRNGTANWPKPMANSQTGIDDLWHAAVNGRGRYFSSKNPALLADDLKAALTGMTAQLGTGAAAATSNLEPQEGDNYSYVASYTTQQWYGNLEARTINITTGQTNEQAIWCIENVAANASKGTTACTGSLQSKVGDASDTRKIYLLDAADAAFGDGSKLRPFTYGNLTATEKTWFVPSTLSQWALVSAPAQAAATGDTLVNYLRGQRGFEKRAGNTYQVYRTRVATLGDAVNSQPVFVSKPKFEYKDPGYATGAAGTNFKSDNAGRQPMVYLGTNEGMLHAFNATTGEELWAYMPTPVLKNLWRLADDDYENKHAFRVDGSPTVGDVCFSNCSDANNADWHTILVGGYSSGARGYYALDISDPLHPKALWEATEATDVDFGLSYGNPVITKRPDGTWVVLLTSGYNNASPGTGEGVLFVVEPATGTVLAKKSNSTGTTATPSGLSKIGAFIENANEDNTTTDVYGGDLMGNVWRFRLLTGNTIAVAKIAEVKNNSSQPQPITTKPILTTLDDAISTRYVIVATGKLLETNDTSDTTVQSLYGFEETYDTKGTIGISPRCVGCAHGARDQLTGQEIINTGTKDTEGRWQRAAGPNSIPPTATETVQGCYADLPLPRERSNVDMKLILGNIAMVSNVPTDDKCAAGGESYMNFFDYKTCKVTQSFKLGDALAVGMVVLKLASGYVVTATLSNDPTPQLVGGVPPPPGTVGFQGKRIGWRLLFD